MVHLSEESRPLLIRKHQVITTQQLFTCVDGWSDVCFLRLPIATENEKRASLKDIGETVVWVAERLGSSATLIVYGDVVDLVRVHTAVASMLRYQLWVALKSEPDGGAHIDTALAHQHVGLLVYTKYNKQLQHTKTRLAYTYCPVCNKTTKDYGGKKHTYHPYGTLISDIWRDISVEANGNIDLVLERLADLFGLAQYRQLLALDLVSLLRDRTPIEQPQALEAIHSTALESQLLNGDCLDELRKLPNNSIDFAFADPPYNLKKEYRGYADDLEITKYFAWCDQWITEIARVLKPGGTFALLNIPLWSIRHFCHLETVLQYQNWIAWDALSFPVRLIMPAHYTILCFSKGEPRRLPNLTKPVETMAIASSTPTFKALAPLDQGFCLRSACVQKRLWAGVEDRAALSDLWWDIHRLKHNSRRVDHPCQLPPQLMYRLIALFTKPNEVVLDCFNGAGTTTLAAHQLGRNYIGIEREPKYHEITAQRHAEIALGLDPFRKEARPLTAKNSPVARLKKQKYTVPKKTLQLEVRRVAELLGHIPNRAEVIALGKYPIVYYDNYFSSWGEVCAAARTMGMTETRDNETPEAAYSQNPLF
jgi:DNA modification methylase